ncbi:MAG TPA: antibiotic biosynthesis monooxygenase [Candidatus Dormibacteraeota bacterium]|nr:antibiotic biosynthesis monooxygenase [Candidatus Dormibacteraeota bacterium]
MSALVPAVEGGRWTLTVHRVDPARADVYLASVDDQVAVLRGFEGFAGRRLLQGQAEPGVHWLLDGWTDAGGMAGAGAAARTLASVAGLLQPPRELVTSVAVLAERPAAAAPAPTFALIAEAWVKAPCRGEYLATLRAVGARLVAAPGFGRRLLLEDQAQPLHFLVLDDWETERAAFTSFNRPQPPSAEMLRFLSLLAERRPPLAARAVGAWPARAAVGAWR